MFEPATFVITIPIPTLDFITIWISIGALVVAVFALHLTFTIRRYQVSKNDIDVLITFSVLVIIWPYLVFKLYQLWFKER
jgi:K+-sensing histidine kinase KdpD